MGCYNREMAPGYYVLEREYQPSGMFIMQQRYIPHTMTTDCRWSIEHKSERCTGCRHNKGEKDESQNA